MKKRRIRAPVLSSTVGVGQPLGYKSILSPDTSPRKKAEKLALQQKRRRLLPVAPSQPGRLTTSELQTQERKEAYKPRAACKDTVCSPKLPPAATKAAEEAGWVNTQKRKALVEPRAACKDTACRPELPAALAGAAKEAKCADHGPAVQTPPQRPRQATALVASNDSAQHEVVSTAEVKFTPLPQPHGLPGWERFYPRQATVQLALGTTACASMSVWLSSA